MAKLNRIQIKGFKSIKELDLKLENINILIGANGSGKSNFLSFFNMLLHIAGKKLQLFVGTKSVDALLFYGRETTDKISVEMQFDEDFVYKFELVPTEENKVAFLYELVKKKDSNKETGSFHDETSILSQADFYTDLDKEIFAVHYNPLDYVGNIQYFNNLAEKSKTKQECNINDNGILYSDFSNLAAVLYAIKNHYPDVYKNIVSTIQLVYPIFDDFVLEPNPHNKNLIQLKWLDKNYLKPFYSYALSDGTLMFICLVTLLLNPMSKDILVIDEPELGLHPYAINVLSELIQSISTKRQLIIATQSTDFINNFEPEDIIVVDRKGNETVFEKKLNSEELKIWLEDYALGDLWKTNLFGGMP